MLCYLGIDNFVSDCMCNYGFVWTFTVIICEAMVLHKVQVKFGDITLPTWCISDEMSFYYGLYCDIYEELKTTKTNPNTRLNITAIIRGGDVVLDVDSDVSLMRMFAKHQSRGCYCLRCQSNYRDTTASVRA